MSKQPTQFMAGSGRNEPSKSTKQALKPLHAAHSGISQSDAASLALTFSSASPEHAHMSGAVPACDNKMESLSFYIMKSSRFFG